MNAVVIGKEDDHARILAKKPGMNKRATLCVRGSCAR
jgi:hypothetical protein